MSALITFSISPSRSLDMPTSSALPRGSGSPFVALMDCPWTCAEKQNNTAVAASIARSIIVASLAGAFSGGGASTPRLRHLPPRSTRLLARFANIRHASRAAMRDRGAETAMHATIEARYDVIVEERECPRPDGSTMALRIARPKGQGKEDRPFPAAIDIHGGGWVLHDRHRNAYIDDSLAAAGIVVAAPEFRMPPEGVYPVSIADNHLAIRWLKQNAAAFGSRPDLVGAIGTSSGGHQPLVSRRRPDA